MKAIRGTRDILPPASHTWNFVEAQVREVFRVFNYQEIRTPIFEETALFARGVGEETDIVTKEMYTFADRDGESITLRPENTAGVMRAYIEHRLDQLPGIQKLYYLGPMFRRERPQKGRYRQFFQIGAEAIGIDSPVLDAEMIELCSWIFTRCGVTGTKLLINSVGDAESRARYIEALRERLAVVKDQLSEDNQRRAVTNPLRVLDSKDPADEPVIASLPNIHDYLNDACKAHFAAVCAYLEDRGIAYEVRPRLVRGLDYYTHTTFEFVHEGALGAQNSICGGGRYNGLAESIGSKIAAPGVGFSIGQDRLVMTVEECNADGIRPPRVDLYIAPMGEAEFRHCAPLAASVRAAGYAVELAGAGKIKKAMELANKLGARFALIVGESEMAAAVYALKNLQSGEQVNADAAALPLLLNPDRQLQQ
jgi:histidyl-tRNA synthetase